MDLFSLLCEAEQREASPFLFNHLTEISCQRWRGLRRLVKFLSLQMEKKTRTKPTGIVHFRQGQDSLQPEFLTPLSRRPGSLHCSSSPTPPYPLLCSNVLLPDLFPVLKALAILLLNFPSSESRRQGSDVVLQLCSVYGIWVC